VSPTSTSAPALAVTHVITGLGAGGAETALHRLVSSTRARLDHDVVSLTGPGHFGPKLLAEGVPVTCLNMRPGAPDPVALVRLIRHLRARRPDVVQSWMYHANLLAGLAAAAAGRIPTVWGIRHSELARSTKRSTRWTSAACAALSGILPAGIVFCAHSALRAHAGMGYRAGRMVVIPNGFAAEALARDPAAGARIRRELSIDEEAVVVGTVSRFHPDKDPDNLLRAARRVAGAEPRAIFVLVGHGLDASNAWLSSRVGELGLRDRVRLLGERKDVLALLSAVDVFAQASRTEAFPNSLGEAMLCSAACVATDCGDSREIVGSTGLIVPVENSAALAGAILELLAVGPAGRAALGARARDRVRERYDLREVARRYADLYAEVREEDASAPARRPALRAGRGEAPCG
jgi:glycosyltransferase involved in cell wall biosynthesis